MWGPNLAEGKRHPCMAEQPQSRDHILAFQALERTFSCLITRLSSPHFLSDNLYKSYLNPSLLSLSPSTRLIRAKTFDLTDSLLFFSSWLHSRDTVGLISVFGTNKKHGPSTAARSAISG